MLPFERERTLANACEVMKSHIEGRGWTLEFERLGADIVTTTCTIRNGSGAVVSSGFGKGDQDTSTVGAMYEAMEHHYGVMDHIDLKVACIPAGEIHADPRFSTLPFISEFRKQKDRNLACAIYEDFHDRTAVPIPLFLIFTDYTFSDRVDGDDFDYSLVQRFGSNSGTAIGATFDEAAIHALNEIVERDAWSLFLLSHFMDTQQKIGRVIDPGSMPEALEMLLEVARHRAMDRDVLLVDITSDIGIPTFVATVSGIAAGESVYPCGFGTSSSPFDAAYRAVTELIQVIDLRGRSREVTSAIRLSLRIVSDYRKIRDCVYFKVDPSRLDHGPWDFDHQRNKSLAAVLANVLFRLRTRGIDICFNVNRTVADTFCVVSCVSMALERFFLVTSGHMMGPGKRGMRLFSKTEDNIREDERAVV